MPNTIDGNFTLGVDLAQVHDFSVVAVVERQVRVVPYEWGTPQYGDDRVDNFYAIRNLHRWDHGASYPKIVAEVGQMMRRLGLMGTPIVLDKSGIGGPPARLFDEAWYRDQLGEVRPWAITITGSSTPAQKSHVPRATLLSELRVLVQQHRITVAADLSLREALLRELAELRLTRSPKGADAYESGAHDDLALSVAMATWPRMRHLWGDPLRYSDPVEAG